MDLPDFVIASMSAEEAESIASWWEDLSDEAQQDFLLLWDERADDCAYVGFIEDERLKWETLPLVLVGEFVEPNSAELDRFRATLGGLADVEGLLSMRAAGGWRS